MARELLFLDRNRPKACVDRAPVNIGAPESVRQISVLLDGGNRASDRSSQDGSHRLGELLTLLNLRTTGNRECSSRERDDNSKPNYSKPKMSVHDATPPKKNHFQANPDERPTRSPPTQSLHVETQ